MPLEHLRLLYKYMVWAHERMLGAIQSVSDEELTRDLSASHHSLRDTLVHMMSAEWMWLSRWHGVFPEAMLDADAFPTLEAIEERWRGIRRELQHFLGRVREDDIMRVFTYRNTSGEERSLPLGSTLLHLVNHDTYHRGQVACLLRQLGHEPPATDLTVFYLEEDVLADATRAEDAPSLVGSGAFPEGDEDEDDEDVEE